MIPFPLTRLGPFAGLTAIVLFLALPSCRMARESRADTTEITIWSMWSGQEERNFENVLHLYERSHPHIHIRNLGAVSDDTKTIRALVAGAPPDLFTLSNPAYLGALARNHAILSLDDQFRQSGLKESNFVPASLLLCRYDRKLFGLPFLIDDVALLWDKQAFREAGLDPEQPPQTLEELAEYAVKLTKRDANGKITRLGLQSPGDLYVLFALYGGQLADSQTGRATPDDPGNVAGLTWYKNLVTQMGGIEQINAFTSGFGAGQGANNPFYVGKVAMMFNGEWNPYWVSRYAPGLQYGVAPCPPPTGHPERARTTFLGGNVFCIPTDSKHPREAWEFLVWTQSMEAQIAFAHDMNNVPNTRTALQAPQLRTGTAFRQQFSKFLDLADSPNGAYFPAMPSASLYMNQLSNATDKVLYGEQTPTQALQAVRTRVQKEEAEE